MIDHIEAALSGVIVVALLVGLVGSIIAIIQTWGMHGLCNAGIAITILFLVGYPVGRVLQWWRDR